MNLIDCPCPLCGALDHLHVATITSRPQGETDFGFPNYYREIRRCKSCSVFFNAHNHISENFYEGHYNRSSENSLSSRFDRITKLPSEQSDNKQRVKRVIDFIERTMLDFINCKILDVGSGTGVFPYEVSSQGFLCESVDPDESSVALIRARVPQSVCYHGSLTDVPPENRYGLITLNKVLEHVCDPVEFLSKTKNYLLESGFVYVELPEGERSYKMGEAETRQEFFVEHITVFDQDSTEYLAKSAGFSICDFKVYDDPSGKRSLYCFLQTS